MGDKVGVSVVEKVGEKVIVGVPVGVTVGLSVEVTVMVGDRVAVGVGLGVEVALYWGVRVGVEVATGVDLPGWVGLLLFAQAIGMKPRSAKRNNLHPLDKIILRMITFFSGLIINIYF